MERKMRKDESSFISSKTIWKILLNWWCVSVCLCVRVWWVAILCITPMGWKSISHLLRPINFTLETQAVIADPFSNYTAVQKMLKVTFMLSSLSSPWDGHENCFQCYFLQSHYFGSRCIYCSAYKWESVSKRSQIMLRKQNKSSTLQLNLGLFHDKHTVVCLISPLRWTLSGSALLINHFSSDKTYFHSVVWKPIQL